MLAHAGLRVSGFDTSAQVRESARRGCGHVKELDVRKLVVDALASGGLTIADQLEPADVIIICVPTPVTADGRADLRSVLAATEASARMLRPGDLFVLESTVPPGTIERVVVPTLQRFGIDTEQVDIAHCPERVIPGNIVEEITRNARVIGGRTPAAALRAKDVYSSFVTAPIEITDCTTAELVKVLENTYRDVNIALANEMAILAESIGIDVWEVIRLANKHPRVNILSPGPGVGGHCIPVDSQFLAGSNPFETELTQTARRVNQRMPAYISRRIERLVSPGSKIALLGAAYKANVDDTRNSPSETIVAFLLERGYEVSVFDPLAATFRFPLAGSLDEAVADASAIVLAVDHEAFRAIEPERVAELMRPEPALLDTRRFFDVARWRAAGFRVHAFGTPAQGTPPVPATPRNGASHQPEERVLS